MDRVGGAAVGGVGREALDGMVFGLREELGGGAAEVEVEVEVEVVGAVSVVGFWIRGTPPSEVDFDS